LYAGIDYARNDQADLYFNVHYHGMDRSFQHGAKLIHLGQTADDYKSRLGSVAWPLHFYARAVNPVMNAGLRLVAKWAFPAIAPPPSYHVFREDMPVASPAAAAAITPDHATAHHSPSR